MEYRIALRNTETGDAIIHKASWDDEQLMLFQYQENNYSCDCNRSLFLYGYDEEREMSCNSGPNIIVIDWIRDGSGKKVEIQTEQEEQ